MKRAILGPIELPAPIVNPRTGQIDRRDVLDSGLRISRCPDCGATVMIHHYRALLPSFPMVKRWESWLPPRFVPLDDGSFGKSHRGGDYRDEKYRRPGEFPTRVHCPSRACNSQTLQVDSPLLDGAQSVQSE